MNIGCGNAFDYHHWFKFDPKKIVGIDVLNYKKSWQTVKKFVKDEKIVTKVEFYKLDIVNFQVKEKFDFIVSDAVFEHCKDFPRVINKCYKLLKKNGFYMPHMEARLVHIWRRSFSGRDNILNGFNHLLLNKKMKNIPTKMFVLLNRTL